jgi:hypothetical protein
MAIEKDTPKLLPLTAARSMYEPYHRLKFSQTSSYVVRDTMIIISTVKKAGWDVDLLGQAAFEMADGSAFPPTSLAFKDPIRVTQIVTRSTSSSVLSSLVRP